MERYVLTDSGECFCRHERSLKGDLGSTVFEWISGEFHDLESLFPCDLEAAVGVMLPEVGEGEAEIGGMLIIVHLDLSFMQDSLLRKGVYLAYIPRPTGSVRIEKSLRHNIAAKRFPDHLLFRHEASLDVLP